MKIKKLYLFQIKKIKKIVLNKFILYKKKKMFICSPHQSRQCNSFFKQIRILVACLENI